MPKTRLDSLLVQRGLFETRSRAAAAVLAGTVRVGDDGRRAEKPGQLVVSDVPVRIDEPPPFVSRGGVKLANALDAFGIDPSGRRCLDVGASTGGFTDCLVQRGAAHVVALDVAYGQLHWRLRNDSRVTVIERSNARDIVPRVLPYAPDLIAVDVSAAMIGALRSRVAALGIDNVRVVQGGFLSYEHRQAVLTEGLVELECVAPTPLGELIRVLTDRIRERRFRILGEGWVEA